MKSYLSILAITAAAFAVQVQAADTDPLATAAQSALTAQLGAKAKDLTVTVSQGVAELHGFAQQPRDVELARYVVSQVPGVTTAYSAGVHTWTSTNSNTDR